MTVFNQFNSRQAAQSPMEYSQFIEEVKSGRIAKVLIEGRLTPDKKTGGPRIWTRQDKTAGASFEVSASTVRFLSSRDEGGQEVPVGDVNNMEMEEVPPEDDIPF